MKSIFKKKPIFLTVIFFFSSFFFSVFAIFFGLIMNADIGVGAFVAELIFRIANWPTIILRLYPTMIGLDVKVYNVGRGFFNPMIILINAIGWALVGLIIGLIISAVKGRRR